MADDFSRLFPPSIARMQWPRTYEKDNRTRIRREELRNYVPNSRQQLVNFINDNFYDGGREGNRYAENAATMLDLPLGLGHGIYDATRAAGEGRLSDSAISAAMALPPPPIKKFGKEVAKAFTDIFHRRGRSNPDTKPLDVSASQAHHFDAATKSESTITPEKSGPIAPSSIRRDTSLVVPKPHITLPDTSLVVPGPHIVRPVSRDALEAKTPDAFIPTFVPYPRPVQKPEIEFTLPRHWKQRSSPWVTQYPPMTMRRRPFRLDYPKDPPTDAQGRILFDMEGRPLTARIVVGRNELGKSDRALTSTEMVQIIQNDLGLDLRSAPKDYFAPGTIGQLSIDPEDGRIAEIGVWNELPADQEGVTIAHELGHAFDLMAKELSMRGINDELMRLYSAHSTGRIGPPYLLPENRGYAPQKASRERAAEAFRIYATGPNTMKSMAPKAAAAIREFNTLPFFSKVIQFNGVPFGVPAGAAAATAAAFEALADGDDANAAPVRQTPETHPLGRYEKTNADRGLVNITKALSRANSYAQPGRKEKLRDPVQTLMQFKHRPRIQPYGGPR